MKEGVMKLGKLKKKGSKLSLPLAFLHFYISHLPVFIVSAVFLARRFSSNADIPFPLFARGLVLFSYARLVAVPLLIWGEADTLAVSVGLANLLLFTSYVTASKCFSGRVVNESFSY